MKTRLTVIGIVAVVFGGIGLAVFVWHGGSDAPLVPLSDNGVAGSDTKAGSGSPAVEETPERLADAKMLNIRDMKERLGHLDWVAEQDWAASSDAIFRRTIVSDPREEVQIRAVDRALELAVKEGNGATSKIVQFALASNKGNTRARGLKAAKNYPDVKLMPRLIEYVDNNDKYAPMALNALAYTDSEEAHAKVREVANNSEAESKLRQRAVALLGIFKDVHDKSLLMELMNGDDQTMRAIASEVMRLIDEG